MGCMFSKRQMSEASHSDGNNIIHPASANGRTPSTTPRSELTVLLSSLNASGPVDQRMLTERPNMEACNSVTDSAAHEPDTTPSQPPLNSATSNQAQPKELECCICREPTKGHAIHPCNECCSPYCIACLKSMFLAACKDETLMPARCCQIIQLPIVLPVLSRQEADLYRAKFEEWSSSQRVYCPIPTCSTFIPSRLIPATTPLTPPQSRNDDLKGNGETLENERQTPNQTVVFGTGIRMEIHTPPPTPPSAEATPISQPPPTSQTPPIPQSPTISCPRCAAQICLSCKQLKHPERPCSADDLDPQLAALLKKWKIKRCPRCRTAVKRMYGCSHIRCRCGAQWCWNCSKPIDQCQDGYCEDQCEGDADEVREAGSESGDSDEDLDAEDEDWLGRGLNFGDEPTDSLYVPWNCERHSLQRVIRGPDAFVGAKAECHRCWKEVQAAEPLASGVKMEHGELVSSQAVNATVASTTMGFHALPIPENAAYHCLACGLINCPACKTAEASSTR